MFGLKDLKEQLEASSSKIICPVLGCKRSVARMKAGVWNSLDSSLKSGETDGKTFDRYFCSDHGIYITPSTFIYRNLRDNLLWPDADGELLEQVVAAKRVKAQLHHDNSEDAVTWNVFRYLERNGLIGLFLGSVTKTPLNSRPVVYWSYSQEDKGTYPRLVDACDMFGERATRRSEPDLLIATDNALFFIEAKLTSGNETSGRGARLKEHLLNVKRYISGYDNWFSRAFASDYEMIVRDQKYELMRFWLIGTYMAQLDNLDFYFINLVTSTRETDIENDFGKHLRQDKRRHFLRMTWESIYSFVRERGPAGEDKSKMIGYFQNKATRYEQGRIQRAFSV